MSLSSLIFVLCFFPIFVFTYFFVRKDWTILLFSLVFYSFSGIKYLLLLVFLTFIGYFFALKIKNFSGKFKKFWLLNGIIIFVAVLFIFKYTDFFIGTLSDFFTVKWEPLNIVLPVGISFYIFKLISYIADVYKGRVEAERNFFNLLLYNSIFPQVLQGPIERFADMKTELVKRSVNIYMVSRGLDRFITGLFKKAVLADNIGRLAITLNGNSTTLAVWMGSIFYSIQLYLDFSGYTDMAVGIGKILGFNFPENFNYPYIATSVRDFWRRWHITLSSWFRDYVYIPLGGNRKGFLRTTLNLLIVWSLTGLWHGAALNFVLWGLFYFPFILFENWWRNMQFKVPPRPFRRLITLFIINFGFVLFRCGNFGELKNVIFIYFGIIRNGFTTSTVNLSLQNNIFLIIISVLFCTPIFKYLFETRRNAILSILKTFVVLAMLVLSIFEMVGGSFMPFLYNQF